MKDFLVILFFLGSCIQQSFAQNQEEKIRSLFPIENREGIEQLRNLFYSIYTSGERDKSWGEPILATLKSAERWVKQHGNSTDRLLVEYYLLMYDDNQLNNDLVINRGETLVSNPEFLKLPESIFALFALNSSYGRKGYYIQQINIINKLIEQNERFGNIGRSKTYAYYNELALVYYNLRQFGLARTNFKKQAELFREADDYFLTSSMLNNIGLTFIKENEPDSAYTYYSQAMNILENKISSSEYYSDAYMAHFKNVVRSNIFKIDLDKADFEDSEQAFMAELRSSKAIKEPRTTTQVYHYLADLYYHNAQYKLAESYNDSTLIYRKKFPDPSIRKDAYLLRAKIALAKNQNKNALKYFDLAFTLTDSLYKANENKNYSEATAKYNFVKTGQALEQNEKQLEQIEKASQLQRIFLSVVIVLSIVIGIILIRVKKSNKLIANQKIALEKGLIEKQIMLDEIHHRTKNNLQVVSGILELQSNKITSKEYTKLFDQSKDYLRSMAMIHELLYDQEIISSLDMQVYLSKLCDLLIQHYPKLNIKYQVKACPVPLNFNKATPLALICCELITNSLKHAFKKEGSISIILSRSTDGYLLEYKDNGIGFNQIKNNDYYNTGLNLIMMLAEDLDGSVNFKNDQGFLCRLYFKD
ncbi:histidine kinase dimerization/phosphoacceptor domain -containing protein [Leeuwenhoekiella palythoae]|uniref:histidine kinase dimerization/phosphoacceptor domain -containing protein n=1 Tax=Leeuwenhoekiella palythoae TaxID=573501 RepID=UPI003517711D